jgi:hypothetical protein
MSVSERLFKKEYYLLYFSVFLIITGSLIVVFDEAGYLMKKRGLELDNLDGLLPATGPHSYINETLRMRINRDYNYLTILGTGITSVGFWMLSLSLMILGLIDTELSEKIRLALIVGAIVVMILVAYGLYSITFSITAGIQGQGR